MILFELKIYRDHCEEGRSSRKADEEKVRDSIEPVNEPVKDIDNSLLCRIKRQVCRFFFLVDLTRQAYWPW